MYTRLCYVHLYVLSSIFISDRSAISCACHSNSSIHHSDNATTHHRRLFPLSALTVLFRTLPLSPYLCRSNAAAAAALALPFDVGVGIGIDSDFSLLCTVVHFMPLFFFRPHAEFCFSFLLLYFLFYFFYFLRN